MISKPNEGEFPPYFGKYISLTPNEILPFITEQKNRFLDLLDTVPQDRRAYSYAPQKWTLKQSIIHVVETEKIFAYRSLALSRQEKQALLGFDQDEYVDNHNSDHLSWEYVHTDFEKTRDLTIHQFAGYSETQWAFIGTMSGSPTINSALPYIVAGHVEHHISLIKSRYLS